MGPLALEAALSRELFAGFRMGQAVAQHL